MSVGTAETFLEPDSTLESVELAGGEIEARTPWQAFWRRFRADRVAMASAVFIVLLILVALLASPLVSLIGVTGPNQTTAARSIFGLPLGPSSAHPFGTDELGRDILARTIYGAQVSLEIAFIATGAAVLIGVTIGVTSGYFRGWVDSLLGRLMDVVLAFPILLLAIGFASACSLGRGCLGGLIQPGRTTLIIVIALSSWPYIGRIVRGQTLSIREKEFVDAARSLGASNVRIMAKEILPNLVAPIIVYSSLILPTNVLYEAALSFLGVGVQPPTPSWGQMISVAGQTYPEAWWYITFPGAALVLTVLAFNLVGDGLQDALNPKTGR